MPQEQASSSRPSWSELLVEIKEGKFSAVLGVVGMESDDEIRRVPDFGPGEQAPPSVSDPTGSGAAAGSTPQAGQSRKERSPADKEHKRLGRLLRNRVSAQQARERKKAHLSDLESKMKELETKNLELEEKLSTLQNENQMLRQILKNTTASSSNGERRASMREAKLLIP